jgi:hypothetical protein
MWLSLQRTLDAGTGGGDVGWPFRLISLGVTLGGIFVVTALIGLTANAIDRRIESLRKGRSIVIERGHTLILGWSSKLPTILTELIEANSNQARSSVVILSPRDRVEMEDDVRRWVPRGTKMKVVCRTGEPYDWHDLAVVNPAHAKSVIMLGSAEYGDAETVKALLCVMRADPELDDAPIVAELSSSRIARAVAQVTEDRVLTVVSNEVIARITAQVCRQPGLSTVYQEVLDFAGDEIYFGSDPRLAGLTFGDALVAFDTSTVLGVRQADGTVRLVPDMAYVLAPGDEVVCITRDDDTIVFTGVPPQCSGDPLPGSVKKPKPPAAVERILVVGWNAMAPALARELDHYARKGSVLHVAADPSLCRVAEEVVELGLKRYRLETTYGDTNDPDLVAGLFEGRPWDHVVVLCYHGLEPADADARALLSLLQLRHHFKTLPATPTVVAEMLDPRDVDLAPGTSVDDFVVSERLTSYVLAQLSENAALAPVFEELFGSEGCELSIYPADRLLPPGRVPYLDLVRAARAVGDIAIGYRRAGEQVVINPAKAAYVDLRAGDEVVVAVR